MANYFAYGTLMSLDIMLEVSNTIPSHAPGRLDNYLRRPVRGELYPGIIPYPDAVVEGMVYFNVPDSVWQKLDRFEGEMYTRETVNVALNDGTDIEAFVYVVKQQFADRLEPAEWSFMEFLQNGKAPFLKTYKGFSSH
jgi:gamma-glutamylcyclotransferase (GGCT)/AIG2-like uncharacterized protein YtfP